MTSATTLWMGDLEPYMDEIFLGQAFARNGETIVGVKLIKHKQTGLPAGYCFVEFRDADVAHTCMLRLNGKVIPGSSPPKRFKLNHASYGKEHLMMPEYSLFVGDLFESVDDLQLYQAFASRYASCRSAKVVLAQGGKSKGYGFVRFTDESDQQRALVEMQHKEVCGKPIRICLATPKRPSPVAMGPPGSNPYYTPYYQQYQQQYGNNYNPYPNFPNQAQYYNYWNQQPQQQQQHSQHNYSYSQDSQQQDYDMEPEGWPNMNNLREFKPATYSDMQQYEEEEEEEDPMTEIDVDQANAECMEQFGEFFDALEESRWQPLDSVTSPIPAAS